MAYTRINLYDDVLYDYLICKKTTATSSDIALTNQSDYVPQWRDMRNIIILANFNNDLISSLITGTDNPVTTWRIYRQKSGETIQHFVAEVPSTQLFIVDYLCANQTTYNYLVIPVTTTELGVSLRSSGFKTCWWDYSITSLKEVSNGIYAPDMVWTFDYNLSSSDVSQNTDITVSETFGKYPKVSKGESNYLTMGLSTLIGGFKTNGNKYYESSEMLELWRDFVTKNYLCIWKDRKGTIKLGKISEDSSAKFQDELSEQLTTISFNFVETQSVDSISAYSTEDVNYNILEKT